MFSHFSREHFKCFYFIPYRERAVIKIRKSFFTHRLDKTSQVNLKRNEECMRVGEFGMYVHFVRRSTTLFPLLSVNYTHVYLHLIRQEKNPTVNIFMDGCCPASGTFFSDTFVQHLLLEVKW